MNGMQEAIRLCNAADEILRAVRDGGEDGLVPIAPDEAEKGPGVFTAGELTEGMNFLMRLGLLSPKDFAQGEDGA